MDNIHEKLQKIKALAESTDFEDERDSALTLLKRLMDKHGVAEQDLYNEDVKAHDFFFKGKRERRLLSQVLYKVIGHTNYTKYNLFRNGRKLPNAFGADCTVAQYVEVQFLFDFYKKLYRQEEDFFYKAFLQKHDIFGAQPISSDNDELSDEQLEKMLNMMEGMDDATPYMQIESCSR